MIEARRLSKAFGNRTAVDALTFFVRPGQVTGFLGPNGAGKSTTLRMIVGLDRPTGGTVTINGRPYAQHRAPLHEVGVLLDAKAVHPARSAIGHLSALAATHGISRRRVAEVIGMTGLESVARNRAGSFSLGMGQRLGIAAALLGDPQTLILDEPINGLDPEGVIWVRTLARSLAAEGRTVLLSSHLMSEMAQTADHLLVIGRGKILVDAPIAAVLEDTRGPRTMVRSLLPLQLRDLLTAEGAKVELVGPDSLQVTGPPPERIAEIAHQNGVLLFEIAPVQNSLEEVYLQLTKDDVEYRSPAYATRES